MPTTLLPAPPPQIFRLTYGPVIWKPSHVASELTLGFIELRYVRLLLHSALVRITNTSIIYCLFSASLIFWNKVKLEKNIIGNFLCIVKMVKIWHFLSFQLFQKVLLISLMSLAITLGIFFGNWIKRSCVVLLFQCQLSFEFGDW